MNFIQKLTKPTFFGEMHKIQNLGTFLHILKVKELKYISSKVEELLDLFLIKIPKKIVLFEKVISSTNKINRML